MALGSIINSMALKQRIQIQGSPGDVEPRQSEKRRELLLEAMMSGKEEYRLFVGGLSWDTSLKSTLSRFGKVLDAQVMLDRETGHPCGFGFVTFADLQSMESAISELHGKKVNGRSLSVNKVQPKIGGAIDAGHITINDINIFMFKQSIDCL